MGKLTSEQVAEIQRLRMPCDHCGGRPPLKLLADQYGVSMAEISRAAHGLVRGKGAVTPKLSAWGMDKNGTRRN